MVEHFYIKFFDVSCSCFSDIMQKNRQTDAAENPSPVTTVCMGKLSNDSLAQNFAKWWRILKILSLSHVKFSPDG